MEASQGCSPYFRNPRENHTRARHAPKVQRSQGRTLLETFELGRSVLTPPNPLLLRYNALVKREETWHTGSSCREDLETMCGKRECTTKVSCENCVTSVTARMLPLPSVTSTGCHKRSSPSTTIHPQATTVVM